MTEAGYLIRPCDESLGWDVRPLWSRKPVVTRDVYVVRDPNTRHMQLALSDDLVGLHGSLDMEPGVYRDSMRRLFTS